MDLKYLAQKIISLETKLSSPNERSFTIEGCDLDRAASVLEKVGHVDGYTPRKLFFQAFLPCYCSVGTIEQELWMAEIHRATVRELHPGRARCFNVAAARKAFVDLYSRISDANSDDFYRAKELAEQMEYDAGASFAHSVRFTF